jgi:hypothetical protein
VLLVFDLHGLGLEALGPLLNVVLGESHAVARLGFLEVPPRLEGRLQRLGLDEDVRLRADVPAGLCGGFGVVFLGSP